MFGCIWKRVKFLPVRCHARKILCSIAVKTLSQLDKFVLQDLCERLWNISDTRKEDAEAERTQIINEGWLEDHIGLLTNHYISLTQGEINKYQDTCKMLRDYFIGMEGGLGPKKCT